jgi:RNA binding exosome subunit
MDNSKEIEEALKKIYSFNVKVKWLDFRIYEVKGYIGNKVFKVKVCQDVLKSFDENISDFSEIIDKQLAILYYKKVGEK